MKVLSITFLISFIFVSQSYGASTLWCWKKGEAQKTENHLIAAGQEDFSARSLESFGMDNIDDEPKMIYGKTLMNSCYSSNPASQCLFALEYKHADYSYYAYNFSVTGKVDLISKRENKAYFSGKIFAELLGDYNSYYYGPILNEFDVDCVVESHQ